MIAAPALSPREQTLFFSSTEVGDEIPPLEKRPSSVQLFRYSAITWNPHRVHYDADYSRDEERHAGSLVQAHLHGAFLVQLLMDWAGPRARLTSFAWRNRGPAAVGDVLTCIGRVVAKRSEGGLHLLDVEFSETAQDGRVCASGTGTLSVPFDRSAQ